MPDDATVVEGDPGFVGMASRLNPVQLPPGLCQLVENMRLDRGVAQTRKGAIRVGDDISLSGDFFNIANSGASTSLGADKQVTITRPDINTNTARATCNGHGYADGDRINIRGANQADYNGDFFITNVTPNTFDFTVSNLPTTPATGTIFANKGPIVKQTYEGGIFASGLYSSPRLDNSNEYIVLVGPNSAYLWRQGASLITKSFPQTDTIKSGDDIQVLQAFDRLYILRSRPETQRRMTTLTSVGGTLADLRDVWNFSTTNMIAVGTGGTILQYNGKIWTGLASGITTNLNAIWAANTSNAWAVGDNGVILRWNGSEWSAQTSDTTEHLYGVFGFSATDIVAVGANGTIRRYNGTSWATVTNNDSNALFDVWGSAANNIFAVGANGTVLRWNGTSWFPHASNTTNDLNAIWGFSATSIYAVGAQGTIANLGSDQTGFTAPTTDFLTKSSHGLSANQRVVFSSLTGGAGLSTNTVYFVRDISGDNFKVSTTSGGTAVDITTAYSAATLQAASADVTGFTAATDNKITKTNHGLTNTQKIVFTSLTGGAGLSTNTVYFVVEADANTFKVSTTSGGTAVGITTAYSAATLQTLGTATSGFASATTDTISKTAHGLPTDRKIIFTSLTGGAGLSLNTVYHVVQAAPDTFKVSATQGGSPIAITTAYTAMTLQTWTNQSSGTSTTLRSVWGSASTNIIATGNGGTILRSTTGTSWSPISTNPATTTDLQGIHGSASTNVAITGQSGTILLSTNSSTYTAVPRGIATATFSSAHGYAVNDVVRISGATDPDDFTEVSGVTTAEAYNGEFVIASVPNSTSFTYRIPGTTFAAPEGIIFAQRVQANLVWDGDPSTNFSRVNIGTNITLNQNAPSTLSFIGMPSTAIATYFNNQVIVARGRDEVLVSDVFDGETYDSILKAFRVNAGSNDFITAIHPFSEQQVLVFCRNSIYLGTVALDASGNLDLAACSLQLLTNEIGCASRRSVVTAGTVVLFLTDRGVFRLDSQFDLKLRGNTQPLSEAIADQFDRINVNAIAKACAAYFNNRYYIALPLMGEDKPVLSLTRPNTATNTARATVQNMNLKNGDTVIIKGAVPNEYNGTFVINGVTSGSTQSFNFTVQNLPTTPASGEIFVNRPSETNRTIFVYNMLTQNWESRDTYGFSVDGFVIATYGTEKRLFANSTNGRLFLLEQSESGKDSPETGEELEDIVGTLLTRRYNFGTPFAKRFTKSTATLLTTTNGDYVELDAITIDPDTDGQVGVLYENPYNGPEDFTLKAPIRRKAHAVDLRVTFRNGRPALRSLTVDAALTQTSQLTRTQN